MLSSYDFNVKRNVTSTHTTPRRTHCNSFLKASVRKPRTGNDQVNRCVLLSKQYRRRRRPRACNLPHAIIKLIHCKRAAWRKGQQSGNFDLYHRLRNDLRRNLKQFYSNRERSLISKGDRKQFYHYVNQRLGRSRDVPQLAYCTDILTDEEAADAFVSEFSNNFTSRVSYVTCTSKDDILPCDQPLLLNCSTNDVKVALSRCANTAAGPDGFSFALIKRCFSVLLKPILIIFQQSLAQGKFPGMWKEANVMPLYKGKGARDSPSSYRPISLCSCVGKLLE